jgi:four helix bundle protein
MVAAIKRFEDISCWQKARELARIIYALSSKASFAKDFGLRDQIRRAVVSVMSNIAEGFERSGTAEFIQFLAIAKGSVGEIEAQLYVALDQGYVNQEEFENVILLATAIKKMLAGLMKYLKQSGIKGLKFKAYAN